jgi:hypothetical protein
MNDESFDPVTVEGVAEDDDVPITVEAKSFTLR